ncbi:MAG: ribosome-binding factor A [Deltaproteobacteria bacterium]|nr:ribosome-binding factor A [Deltaproteobacteria bacterium]
MTKTRGRRRKMPAPFSEDPFADERGFDKRKLRQLCRQVERALHTALLDDCHDPVLMDLMVQDVLPWPNASRLLVALVPTQADAAVDRELLLAHLEAARGVLREVVAGAIHRKRTPELSFEVFSPGL